MTTRSDTQGINTQSWTIHNTQNTIYRVQHKKTLHKQLSSHSRAVDKSNILVQRRSGSSVKVFRVTWLPCRWPSSAELDSVEWDCLERLVHIPSQPFCNL